MALPKGFFSRLSLGSTVATARQLAEIYQTTVTLTNAQIKALQTTAVTIEAAPGSGYMILPFMALIVGRFTAGAYTNINATDCWLGLTISGSDVLGWSANDSGITHGVVGTANLSSFLSNVNSILRQVAHADTENVNEWGPFARRQPTSNFNNAPLIISMGNGGSGDLTGGHANNTMAVTVYYTIAAVP